MGFPTLENLPRSDRPQQICRNNRPGVSVAAPASMLTDPAGVNDLTSSIIAGAIRVHRDKGPGLLESVYQECMEVELRERGLRLDQKVLVPLTYRGRRLVTSYELDLLVEKSGDRRNQVGGRARSGTQCAGVDLSEAYRPSGRSVDQLQRPGSQGRSQTAPESRDLPARGSRRRQG